MKVLVACEESQVVCNAFRANGHDAYSCDILPTRGAHPEWHIQDDVLNVIKQGSTTEVPRKYPVGWDMMIAFPPCDHLAVSGAKWFAEKRKDGRQKEAIEFFLKLWGAPFEKIAIENPIGIMSGKREYLKKWYPDLYERAKDLPKPQIIQPWMFGHPEKKATCIWSRGLPELKPTNDVRSEMETLPINKQQRCHYMAPGPNRSRDRAVTFQGIAEAMSTQWSNGAP